MRRNLLVAIWIGLTFAVSTSAAAQQVTVSGTVYDPSEAVVPGATVRIQNNETNQFWETTTDERGRFRLLSVPVGESRLSAELDGFVPADVTLTLAVGQVLDVPLTLALSATETVSVSTSAPIVETARTQVAATVTPHDIDSLPLNGRNYLDLALLAPNVSRTNIRSNERFAETSAVPGTGISVAGQRNIGNTFIVDGLSANDDAADLAGTYFGEEVIREFQVVTSGGTAEFGRASGGIVNIVTQSGTNRTRGRAYGFFRNDALDARNRLATTKDPLSQNQYGITFGGPIVRDRTFWFANFERTQQDKTGFITIAPANATAINQVFDALRYPGARVRTGPFQTGYHTTNLFGRVDHQATTQTRLAVRYSVYDVESENARGVGGLSDVSRGTSLSNRDQTLAANALSSLGTTAVNDMRAQFTRSDLRAPANDATGPAVTISGVASSGTSTSSPTGRELTVIQAADTFTAQRGRHLLKAGADLLYNRTNITFPGAMQGSYTFSSLANLQRGVYVQYQQAFGAPSLFQSNPNVGLFAQDEWQPRADVTVQAGVRYDLQWLPDPIQLDANNVSPRIGIAWAPGDQQTVVRGSGGIYFDRIPLRATSNALQRDGINYKVAVMSYGQTGAPVFPNVLETFPAGTLTAITSIDPAIDNGYSTQAALQVERGFGRVASATVGYSYLRGRNIIMSRNINVPTLTAAEAAALGVPNLGRPNPNFGNISQYQSIGDSWFHGLTLSVGSRNTDWGSARVSYTLARALDDAGNAFFQSPQDSFDVLADKGPSDNDQRHRLVVSGTLGGAQNSRISRALAGMQIGYVLSFATGAPFNPVTGTDRNNDTNVNDRPIGMGRNSFRQASSSTLDLRVSRAIAVNGRHRLEGMVEAFNVFNHFNVVNVNNTFGTGETPNATFGKPTVAGDPRQVQLGVRWSF
jgi:hypothetical protein